MRASWSQILIISCIDTLCKYTLIACSEIIDKIDKNILNKIIR